MLDVSAIKISGNANAPIANIACKPFKIEALPGANSLIALLQKLLVAPRASPVIKKAAAIKKLWLPKIIIKYDNAKNELKIRMHFFLPMTEKSAPDAKLDAKLPMECKLTIRPQKAYSNPRASLIYGKREPMDKASIPLITKTP